MYPRWAYYPQRQAPPSWVAQLVGLLAAQQPLLDTAHRANANTSDKALEVTFVREDR